MSDTLNLFTKKNYNIKNKKVFETKKTESIIGNRLEFNNQVFNNWNIANVHIRKFAKSPYLLNYIYLHNITDTEHKSVVFNLPDKVDFTKINLNGNLLTVEVPMINQVLANTEKFIYDFKNKIKTPFTSCKLEFILADDARIKTEKMLVALHKCYQQQDILYHQISQQSY